MARQPSVAIIGAGMGGLTVAATLRQIEVDVTVYEQASTFGRIGAGIQMMPNSMKVLRNVGVEEMLRAKAFEPFSHLNRVADTGEVKRELPMPESLFGAPYLCMHRADLHEALRTVSQAMSSNWERSSRAWTTSGLKFRFRLLMAPRRPPTR